MAGEAFPHHLRRGGGHVDGRCSGPDGRTALRHGAGVGSDIRLTVPARPENVAVVRHVVAALAEVLGLAAPVVADMRLAVTEACTNVVRHAYGAGDGSIDVLVRPNGDSLVVAVADAGGGMRPSNDRNGPGFGLPLIAALADTLDIDDSPQAGSRLVMSFRRRGRSPRTRVA